MLVLLPDRDRAGRNDYRGAFRPEADRLRVLFQLAESQVLEIPAGAPKATQREALRFAVELASRGGPLARVLFLCHGESHWLQLGEYRLVELAELAEVLAPALLPAAALTLYCCHTGEVPDDRACRRGGEASGCGEEGGLAAQLYGALAALGLAGVRVDGHERAGHTTRNPYVRRFDGASPLGRYLVTPGGPLWGRFSARLHDVNDPLRFTYPSLSDQELAVELGAEL